MDRLMKDIVLSCPTQFDILRFLPLLTERMKVRDPYVRQFLLSWISLLDSAPGQARVARGGCIARYACTHVHTGVDLCESAFICIFVVT